MRVLKKYIVLMFSISLGTITGENNIFDDVIIGFGDVDIVQGSLEVTIESSVLIGGFQFSVTGVTILSVQGGLVEEYGFTVSNSSSTVIGFSLTGETIPLGSGVLMNILFIDPSTDICLENVIVSDLNGVEIDTEVGPCWTTDGIFGCTDENSCSYDPSATLDDGSCQYIQSYSLHSHANLISFLSLPDDNEIDNVLPPDQNQGVIAIIGEGVASMISPHLDWVGSLTNLDLEDGYWVIMSQDDVISTPCSSAPGNPDLEYSLGYGSNLISFPLVGSYDINEVLPSEVISVTVGVIGEGVASSNIGGQFVGSLSELEGGKGYWFKTTDDVTFQFIDSSD